MKKKHLFVAALFLAALAFGFVGCENPDDDLLNNSGNDTSITDNDSTTNNPNQGGNLPDSLALPTMVATRGATDVGYSTVTLWGRINTDTLWAFNNIRWGIECSTIKEEMQSHKGKRLSALPTLWARTPMSTLWILQRWDMAKYFTITHIF